jgi:hypothetical protein
MDALQKRQICGSYRQSNEVYEAEAFVCTLSGTSVYINRQFMDHKVGPCWINMIAGLQLQK